MKIEAACGCHIGKIRENNEDNFCFDTEYLPIKHFNTEYILKTTVTTEKTVVFGVFDGMGGEQRGEEASYIAAETFQKCIRRDKGKRLNQFLLEVCLEANDKICTRMKETKASRMGTTAAILMGHDDQLWACNIGDSKIYVLNEGNLVQCSVDHTDSAYLKKRGITGRKPVLTQHLGISPDEMMIAPYVKRVHSRTNETYVICSDGLTDMVSTAEMEQCLRENTDVSVCVEKLIDLALEHGGSDNITVIVCQCKDI